MKCPPAKQPAPKLTATHKAKKEAMKMFVQFLNQF